MNVEIRAQARAKIQRMGISRTDLARQLGRRPQDILRLLTENDGVDMRGEVNQSWQQLLDLLGYELVLVDRSAPGSAASETDPQDE